MQTSKQIRKRGYDKCICGYEGRQDNVKTHKNKCKLQKKLEVLSQNVETLPAYIQLKQENMKLAQDNLKLREEQMKVMYAPEVIKCKQENIKLQQENLNVLENLSKSKGQVYILQTRESIRMQENVYKIGMTTDMKKRMATYTKGSQVLKLVDVSD